LFAANVQNVVEGNVVAKHFISGHYTIQDILCKRCFSVVGWKYITARENDNKFKETNYVIEDCKVLQIKPSEIILKRHGHLPREHKITKVKKNLEHCRSAGDNCPDENAYRRAVQTSQANNYGSSGWNPMNMMPLSTNTQQQFIFGRNSRAFSPRPAAGFISLSNSSNEVLNGAQEFPTG
jgi:predicted secreted acid phosphatase